MPRITHHYKTYMYDFSHVNMQLIFIFRNRSYITCSVVPKGHCNWSCYCKQRYYDRRKKKAQRHIVAAVIPTYNLVLKLGSESISSTEVVVFLSEPCLFLMPSTT